MKSGFISLVGRPNAGKSTLLNNIIGKKIAITSAKPQTTRDNIQGIYNDEESQMIFVDTPGIHKPKHKLGKHLNREAYYSIDDVDIILFLVDACEKFGKGDEFVLEKLKQTDKPVFLILTKVDKIPKMEVLSLINEYKDLYDFKEIIPLSATKNDNVDALLKTLKSYLPDTIKYYEDGQVTNKPLEFRLKEMVREKILRLTEEEVPHSATCYIEKVERHNNSFNVGAIIVVDRDALKRIIIGKNGQMLKKIGMLAREDIEKEFGKKVYLELFVKVMKNWRDRENYLTELGYSNKDEF
jgi:GTP-binding protein Era